MAKQIILIFSFLTIFAFDSYSTHIVGGDVTYECLGFNTDTSAVTLRIEFTIYRDLFSGGAPFDNNAVFGVWAGSGDDWRFYNRFDDQTFTDRADIEIEDNPCVDIPSNVGVEKAVYRFNVVLELNGDDYIIGYQRCCRNPTINNLINPGDTGAAFQIEITAEALALCNNSPQFNNFPPIFICANYDIDFDHSATDAEGDILVYEFCAPLQSGGTVGTQGNPGDPTDCDGVRPNPQFCMPIFDPVDYAPPYSALQPIQGDPMVSIDPTTGLISGAPSLIGQYVVGVCVKEFRDGVLLGEIRRDFQFNTVICTPLVFAEIDAGVAPGDLTYNIASCGQNTVNIKNTSYQESSILSYSWWFENAPGDTMRFNTRDVSVTFDDIGTYEGRMILNEGTECSDTADVIINIFPSIEAEFASAYDTCIAGPVMFSDSTVTGADDVVGWDWDFNDGGISNQPNPNYLFEEPGEQRVTLVATDTNNCKDTLTKEITWYPVPPLLIVQPSKFLACAPGEISFLNLSDPINEDYTINWNFGDGNTATEISPVHVFENPGVYSVDLEIISPIGCVTEKSYPNWITVEEKPTANFSFTPEMPTIFDREVDFTDLSIDSESQQWNFNNEFVTLEQNPTYTFQDTGLYEIRLVAFHETGCPDTIVKYLDIEPLVEYFMPNAFTPNGDGNNDDFIGKGYIEGLKDFQMNIWNRWGEQVFETNDPYNGWNGRKYNNGEMSPQGVYVWELKYIGPRGGDESIKGHVTLLR